MPTDSAPHTPEPVPSEPELTPRRVGGRKKYKVGLVDVSAHVESRARDVADAKMTAPTEQVKGFKGFFRKIWRHNLAKDYYRNKEVIAARERILNRGVRGGENLYADDSAGRVAHEEAMQNILDRFSSEHENEEVLRRGEKRESLGETEEERNIKNGLRELVVGYAQGRLNDDAFEAERTRILNDLRGRKRDVVDRGIMYSDNLKEIARQIRANIEHGEGLDALDFDLEVTIGQAKDAVRTEANFNAVDRWTDRIMRSRVGQFVNETSVSTAVAIAYTAIAGASQRVARSKAAAWGTLGASALVGGIIAGARESRTLEEEKSQHAREMAQGKTFDKTKSPRRAEMEKFRHEYRSANELANLLENNLYVSDAEGNLTLRTDASQADLDAALANISEIEARIQLSDRENIDLIGYSSVENTEKEQTRLLILKARAKKDIEKLLTSGTVRTEPGTPFTYEVGGLATSAELQAFMDSPEMAGLTIPKERIDRLAYWLQEQRVAKGFTVPEIEAAHAPFSPDSAEEYAKWDFIRAEEALNAKAATTPDREVTVASSLVLSGGRNLRESIDSLNDVRRDALVGGDNGIERKNQLFKQMKHKRVAIAVTKGVVTGLIAGTIAQELGSFLRANQTGLVEGMTGHNMGFGQAGNPEHATALEGARRTLAGWINGHGAEQNLSLPGHPMQLQELDMGGHHFRLPMSHHLEHNPDGSFKLIGPDGPIAEHMTFNPNTGLMDNDSQRLLIERGYMSGTDTQLITEHVKLPQPAEAFVESKGSAMQQIKRLLWFDNDTPKPVFDKNELRLWWGGGHNVGINANGDYEFTVQHMTPDGSYHDGLSVDPQKVMRASGLKMLLSVSQDTQNKVFEVPIGADGKAIIPHDSEIGKLLFHNTGGKAEFIGKYAEVAEMVQNKEGVDQVRILATHVGKGLNAAGMYEETVETAIPHTVIEDLPGVVHGEDYEVDPPLFIPIFGRTPLEPTKPQEEIPPYYLYNDQVSSRVIQRIETNRSQTLKDNPKAKLDHYAESEKYISSFSEEYRKKLEALEEQIEPMEKSTRACICIPVAGHQEESSIYQSLESYARQTASPKDYELVLFVNHPEKDPDGKKIKPDGTLKEIKRFKKDYPDLAVRVIYSPLPEEEANIGTIRKMLNDVALKRHHVRGAGAADLIMISNDADNKGISPDYVENFLNKFEAEPSRDGFLGQLDWDPESYVKYPLVHIGTRLFQYLGIINRRKTGRLPSSGANFAFRSSIYASVGGYLTGIPGGEDIYLGRAIVEGRKNKSSLGFAGARTSRLYTSSRRAIKALKEGLAPIEQWTKGFSPFDDEVRRLSLDEAGPEINYDNPAELDKFKKQLEYIINRTLEAEDVSPDPAVDKRAAEHVRKAIGWLGIKYNVEGGAVKITDMSDLIRGLKNYKEYGVVLRDAKSGNPKAKARLSEIMKDRDSRDLPLRTETAPSDVLGDVAIRPETTPTETEPTKRLELPTQEIRSILEAQIGNRAKIDKLEFLEIPNGSKLNAELDAGMLGGKILIEASIVNRDNEITVKDLRVDARGYIKSRIENNVQNLVPAIRQYFKKKHGGNVSKINIVGSNLVVDVVGATER